MLLGYKKRFQTPIEKGLKIHTMRDVRKMQPKTGETLYMYTGLRTSYCELITKEHTLRSTQSIKVRVGLTSRNSQIWVDGRALDFFEVNEFVTNDGFADLDDFAEWWISKVPKKERRRYGVVEWSGSLHHWTDLRY